jgi:radical SAM protein with 4Fe4S-binding SPASM domain
VEEVDVTELSASCPKDGQGESGSPRSAERAPATPIAYRQKHSAANLVAARAAATGAPWSAMVEIADRCNEACVHCYQVQGNKGEIGTEHWERIFRELAELGVMFLTISGGEATLRKDFLHLVAYARRLRFAVKIFSNGLKITPKLAAELGRLSVQEVQISLYSHRAELHDAVTRVPGSFTRLITAVQALRAAKVKVVLKSPLMSSNAPEYSEYVTFVTSLGADYMLDPKLNPRENGDLEPTTWAIDKQTYLGLRRDPRFEKSRRPIRERPLDASVCGACKGNVHVEPNGELRPCTLWNVPTGHALETSLRDAWYGNASARAIRGLTWNDLPGCRACDLRPFCGRCFAESERYTGDALAPYPLACRSALWKYEAEHGVEPELVWDAQPPGSEPVGPFRRDGEHRFAVNAAQALSRSGPERTWLPARAPAPASSSSPSIVPLRRGATGSAIRLGAGSPSGCER